MNLYEVAVRTDIALANLKNGVQCLLFDDGPEVNPTPTYNPFACEGICGTHAENPIEFAGLCIGILVFLAQFALMADLRAKPIDSED